jgi:hypothetical protein
MTELLGLVSAETAGWEAVVYLPVGPRLATAMSTSTVLRLESKRQTQLPEAHLSYALHSFRRQDIAMRTVFYKSPSLLSLIVVSQFTFFFSD